VFLLERRAPQQCHGVSRGRRAITRPVNRRPRPRMASKRRVSQAWVSWFLGALPWLGIHQHRSTRRRSWCIDQPSRHPAGLPSSCCRTLGSTSNVRPSERWLALRRGWHQGLRAWTARFADPSRGIGGLLRCIRLNLGLASMCALCRGCEAVKDTGVQTSQIRTASARAVRASPRGMNS
jgi:hypothetical protein